MEKLESKLDNSVNFVEERLKGFVESRYVRKTFKNKLAPYFICYLSSHTGCNQGCKFCHLTATKQLDFKHSDMHDYLAQSLHVFSHYRRSLESSSDEPATYMHYNFMARGEALANHFLLKDADSILLPLANLALKEGLNPKFNVSTIMPVSLRKELTDVFKIVTPTIYYSMYSTDEDFRNEWMPTAMPAEQALEKLKRYQDMTKKIVKLHFALIKGKNDDLGTMEKMFDLIDKVGLACEFNMVRYNPFSPDQGEETDDETRARVLEYIQKRLSGSCKVIERVGFDVKASCGLFVGKKE